MPEAWVGSQNDTIDSERRIIFVADKEPVPCQATQQGTRSRTPAGGLGLFQGGSFRAKLLPTQSPCRDPAPTKNKKVIEGTEGLKEQCCSVEDVGGAAGSETDFLQCQRAEKSRYTQTALGVGAPATLTHPVWHRTASGTGEGGEQLPSCITKSMQDRRGLPTYLLGAPGALGMDEETLFAGRGASTCAQIETFSKRERQRARWAERLLHSKAVLRGLLKYSSC